ncbi:[acyl-carrier-protein] S-malonyltransferase [Stackebrandtia endophytica]|uniref:[acyl-carrier-protein] S-malonyltransferase n=1 Tax=Stackebrandtia endophytica TaxID=1496996 RepID=A0A543ARB6_9ACTN|nr:ACP S-malonyltransferase [Stackebrandtia endophytica]TQL75121.1 [acyl-carrier-protein] S-malonyltransferase [Stackebrandtia endophytica]
MLAVLSPGQGSQKPGFLSAWLDLPGARERLEDWSRLCDIDLVHLGTVADQAEITDTARTQPLLVAAALLAAEHLPLERVDLVAGHSVGELAAAHLAGVISAEDAVQFAAVRGREMAAACAAAPTSMSAVLGGSEDEVLDAIQAAGAYPANRNGAGQIVAAGSTESLAKLEATPPAKARIIPLSVAGAFHTPYMEPAQQQLAAHAASVTTTDPTRTWLSNADGQPMASGEQALQRLVAQVTAPVRWDSCMESMAERGVTAIIELPPAGTLAGLAKRQLKGIEIIKLNTPDDLAAAVDLIDRVDTEGKA